jgi:hypothetical protein
MKKYITEVTLLVWFRGDALLTLGGEIVRERSGPSVNVLNQLKIVKDLIKKPLGHRQSTRLTVRPSTASIVTPSPLDAETLGGQLKIGHLWTPQNRPLSGERSRLWSSTLSVPPAQVRLHRCASSEAHI